MKLAYKTENHKYKFINSNDPFA